MQTLLLRAAALGLALALGACSSVPPATGDAAAPCCASLDALDYRPLALGEPLRVAIGADAPRVAWPEGTSPVAAFRLPAAPRPLLVELSSHMVSGPGLLEKIYLAPLAHRQATAFAPVLHLFDAQHRETRREAVAGPTNVCAPLHVGGDDEVASLVLTVAEPAGEATFLVVGTSDALRERRGDRICDDTPLVWGERADLRLRVRALPEGTGPVRLIARADWRPGRREPSLGQQVLTELRGARAGWLVLDDRRLQFVDAGEPSRARLVLPLDRLLRSFAEAGRTLAVAVPGADGRALDWHAFQFDREPRALEADATRFAQGLEATIGAGRLVEPVDVSVPPWPAEVGFELRPGGRAPLSGPAREIVDTATAAGIVTAFPCGLCQAGGCGPELLAPCAAAFAVGAVVGGTWAAGRELLRGGFRTAPQAPATAPPADAREPARGQLSGSGIARLNAEALGACLRRGAEGEAAAGWRQQGLRASLRLPGDATPGLVAPAQATVRIDGLALVADAPPGRELPGADALARLVARGAVLWRDGDAEPTRLKALEWSSPARSLEAWAAVTPEALARELDEACTALARDALDAAAHAWRERR